MNRIIGISKQHLKFLALRNFEQNVSNFEQNVRNFEQNVRNFEIISESSTLRIKCQCFF